MTRDIQGKQMSGIYWEHTNYISASSLVHTKGFTLVEALVTLAIMGLMAGGLLSVMNLHNREINEGIGRSRLLLQSQALRSEIMKKVWEGNQLLSGSGRWTRSIHIYTTDNPDMYAQFRVRTDSTIEEMDTSGGTIHWKTFRVGDDSIRIDRNPDSAFYVDTLLDRVALNFGLTIDYSGERFLLEKLGGMYRCRR